MAQDTVFYQKTGRIFEQRSAPLIMGILNVTPDSFSDGGKYTKEDEWLKQAGKMVAEGAGIIDIGACSTRPGAEEITVEEELSRLIPAVLTVRKTFPELMISADTYRAEVAREAVKAGADIINDISGGSMDEDMFRTVAELGVPYVLMHIQGTPQTMQNNPTYEHVTKDVLKWLKERLHMLQEMGVKEIIVDPGFGFGKTVENNFQLLRDLEEFTALGHPVLVGFSKKSMINKLLKTSPNDSIIGTSLLNYIALQKGAKILRVHDVKEAGEVLKVEEYLENLQ
jgi:dihydropteroate synthase